MSKRNERLLTICECAIMVAAAYGLSFLKIPIGLAFGAFGGSIDLVMIPIIIISMRRGFVPGILTGLVFGTIKYFLAGGFAISWQSMLLDYTVAYMFVGFAGLLHKCKGAGGYALGAFAGCFARFAVHYLSGVTIYAEYMPESFMEMTMTSPYIYSILYNGTYMLPNTVIAVVACALLAGTMAKIPLSIGKKAK